MDNIESLLGEMIDSFFNINLYGPSGCGKTNLINKVYQNKSKSFIYVKFNLSDFYSKKNIFNLISKNLNKNLSKCLKDKGKSHVNPLENINKWYDLYQTLQTLYSPSLKIYYIIDSILDMESFNYYKKELIKFFVAINSCKNMKIILISNFDITNSEIQYDYDFSSFISVQFPVLSNEELKEIINNKCQSKYLAPNKYNELVNTCINNFQYNFSNLNEILFNIKQNVSFFDGMTGDSPITEFMDKTKIIEKSEKKRKEKKEKNDEEDIEMKDLRNKEKDDIDKGDYKIKEEKEEKDINKREESRSHSKHDRDIYTFNNHSMNTGQPYSQTQLRNNIKSQTKYAPIHLMKLETFFKRNKLSIIGAMDEGDQNENEDKNNANNSNHTKNLTESLSKSQKILLLASFLASEISTKNDKSLFKAAKNRSAKKLHRKNNNLGYNLKSNVGYPFNVHRLTAIYQSLLSSNEQNFEHDDIMLKCEIATLAKLGLIRAISGFDSKAIDQKYFSGINLDFASKIEEDYNIKLEDYIKYEKID